MSRRAISVCSECIDRVGHGVATNVGFEALAAYNVYRLIEEACNVFLDVHVIKNRDAGVRIEFDHDVDVAIRTVVTPSHRPEQGSMLDPTPAQGMFTASQGLKGFGAIHALQYIMASALPGEADGTKPGLYCSSTILPLATSKRFSFDRNDIPSRFSDSAASGSTKASTSRTTRPPSSIIASRVRAALMVPLAVETVA